MNVTFNCAAVQSGRATGYTGLPMDDEIPTIEGSTFTWSGRKGVTEASTLGWTPGSRPPYLLRVRSHRTGRTNLFLIRHAPTAECVEYADGSGNYITVFND